MSRDIPEWAEQALREVLEDFSNDFPSFDYERGKQQFMEYIHGRISDFSMIVSFKIDQRFDAQISLDGYAALAMSELHGGVTENPESIFKCLSEDGHGYVALSPLEAAKTSGDDFVMIPLPQTKDKILIASVLFTLASAVAVLIGEPTP